MKKALSTLLAVCMLLSVIPAFGLVSNAAPSEKAAQTVEGLTLTSYAFVAHQPEWGDAFKHLMGQKSMGYQLNYDTNKMYDQTIDDLLYWSEKMGEPEETTEFGDPDSIVRRASTKDTGNYLNNYLIKWEGTITAAQDMKFTVVGNKIDNGFIMTIDGKRVYEYWGTGYFDHDDDKLPSDLGQVSLKKGDHKIEAWFLEIDGGAPLDMGVYPDGTETYTSFADAGLTFKMTATTYHTIIDRWGATDDEKHAWVKAFADAGQKMGNGADGEGKGGNKGQCIPENQMYDETIDALLAASVKIGSIVVPRVDTLTLHVTDESYLNMYDGFITVDETGYYLFGCEKVDNAFMIDIIDGNTTHRAYEFWANATWNDADGTWTWMPEGDAVYLEANKTYGFKAAFAEFNGGQKLWPRVTISQDGETFDKNNYKEMNETLHYTTVPPTDNDTVDPSVLNGKLILNSKVDLESVATDMSEIWGDSPVKDIFDNNKNTKMGSHKKWEGGTVTWQTTEPITVTNYLIRTSNVTKMFDSVPVAWVLLGSNDGKEYTIIDKVSRGNAGIGADDFSEGVFAVDKPAAYTYYKLQLVNTWNGNGDGDQDVSVSIADLNLYGDTLNVANAEQLQAAIATINSTSQITRAEGYPYSGININITDDIDLSKVESWTPIYRYNGVINGNGHKITGLDFNMVVSTDNILGNDNSKTPYVYQSLDGSAGNCFAYVSVAALVVEMSGGEIKNITVKDSSLDYSINPDKFTNMNYRTDVAFLVGHMTGGKINNVKLENVDVAVNSHVNAREDYLGYTALAVGRSENTVTLNKISADKNCSIDTSENGRMEAAAILGKHEGEEKCTVSGCTSEAEITVCANIDSAFTSTERPNGEKTSGVAGDLYKDGDVTVPAPKTGDLTTIVAVIAIVSILGMAVTVVVKRRRVR